MVSLEGFYTMADFLVCMCPFLKVVPRIAEGKT